MSEKKPSKSKRPVLTLGENLKKNPSSQGGNNPSRNIFDEPHN